MRATPPARSRSRSRRAETDGSRRPSPTRPARPVGAPPRRRARKRAGPATHGRRGAGGAAGEGRPRRREGLLALLAELELVVAVDAARATSPESPLTWPRAPIAAEPTAPPALAEATSASTSSAPAAARERTWPSAFAAATFSSSFASALFRIAASAAPPPAFRLPSARTAFILISSLAPSWALLASGSIATLEVPRRAVRVGRRERVGRIGRHRERERAALARARPS